MLGSGAPGRIAEELEGDEVLRTLFQRQRLSAVLLIP